MQKTKTLLIILTGIYYPLPIRMVTNIRTLITDFGAKIDEKIVAWVLCLTQDVMVLISIETLDIIGQTSTLYLSRVIEQAQICIIVWKHIQDLVHFLSPNRATLLHL